MQPIQVWGHWGAPNPWKVRILLDELELPYNFHVLELPEAKSEEHVKLNPNGRLPTIEDPNTGITLWESGGIILYLIDNYDKEGKLSYLQGAEKYHAQQWLAFQISGQGPYFGQATWFARFHPERIPSATDRYIDEIKRVIGVLNEGLERNGTGWLVGDRCTYADLSFVTWAIIGEGLLAEFGQLGDVVEKSQQYARWMHALIRRPVVSMALKEITENRKAHGLT